jgi:hypothetical protein
VPRPFYSGHPMFDPKIAVEFRVLMCAMRARSGQIKQTDIYLLMRDILVHQRGNDALIEAVLDFDFLCHTDPVRAGSDLHEWLLNAEASPRSYSYSAVAANLAELETHPHYNWQNRVDING